MALMQYSDRYWYPSGSLAVGALARVFPLDSNILAPLFTDGTGSTSLDNPLAVDETGTLSFWAEAGEYWIHIDTETFRVVVGDTPIAEELADVTLATGVVYGGELTLNDSDPTAIDIDSVSAFIVDESELSDPVVHRVEEPAKTVQLDAAGQSRALTWWLMDSDGSIIQQATEPTPVERRQYVVLGTSFFDQDSSALLGAQSLPTILPQQDNQVVDLMEALGPFKTRGLGISPVAGTLSFNIAAGNAFARAFQHGDIPLNPHNVSITAKQPASFRYATRAVSPVVPPLVTSIDPANYDTNGTVTPVGGGTNRSTIQRVWISPGTAQAVTVQYGQLTYSSLSAAVDRIGAEAFVVNPTLDGLSVLLGYIAVIRSATNLNDPAQAVFVNASKFANS